MERERDISILRDAKSFSKQKPAAKEEIEGRGLTVLLAWNMFRQSPCLDYPYFPRGSVKCWMIGLIRNSPDDGGSPSLLVCSSQFLLWLDDQPLGSPLLKRKATNTSGKESAWFLNRPNWKSRVNSPNWQPRKRAPLKYSLEYTELDPRKCRSTLLRNPLD